MHWVWGMRQSAVCESLLAQPFLEALKGGDNGVHETAIMMDPRVMGHAGRPAGTTHPNDPGELSGVVWFVEATLDADLRRKQHEEGRKARAEYHAVRRSNGTTADCITRLENTYRRAQVLGEFWQSDTARTDQLFVALQFDQKDVQQIMLQVGSDLRRYDEIKQICRDVYPCDNSLTYNNPAKVHLAITDGSPGASSTNIPSPLSLPVPGGGGQQPMQYQETPQEYWQYPSSSFDSSGGGHAYYGNPAFTGYSASEGQWTESGAWVQELPVWFQDLYSGAYWSQETGAFPCS